MSVINIPHLCAIHGIRHAIIAPGSRSAPLTIAFLEHTQIQTKIIFDERSAAFIALGMAQHLQMPVVLICTSGTAPYHFAPALAEAYYQQIPLLVLTADRPVEWMGQQDGQMIDQQQIYGKNVKKSYQYCTESHPDMLWYHDRILQEAIFLSQQKPSGPVHINIPLREPLYLSSEKKYGQHSVKKIRKWNVEDYLPEKAFEEMSQILAKSEKVLVLLGQQHDRNINFHAMLQGLLQNYIPVIGDITANIHDQMLCIKNIDWVLSAQASVSVLQPTLLISLGKSVLSKRLKQFFRQHQPAMHWHFQPGSVIVDTFQSVTDIFAMSPIFFFQQWNKIYKPTMAQQAYFQQWRSREKICQQRKEKFFSVLSFGDFSATVDVLKYLPTHSILHIGNSMPIRYVDLIGIHTPDVLVYANRGTNGIDGTTSTAIGNALVTSKKVVLLTGDVAFFYDQNAFWHHEKLKNVYIILLNNHGGNIFRLMTGAKHHSALSTHFEGCQPLNAAGLAQSYGFDYHFAENQLALQDILKDFFQTSDRLKILEIKTDKIINQQVWERFVNKK